MTRVHPQRVADVALALLLVALFLVTWGRAGFATEKLQELLVLVAGGFAIGGALAWAERAGGRA